MDSQTVPSSLIQINADEQEVCRRIKCFIDKKREEIDRSNVHDFIETGSDLDSCARVNSVVFRTKDSKGHLKSETFNSLLKEKFIILILVRRVKNEYGPQDVDYKNALNKLMDHPGETKNHNTFNSINERLKNAEQSLEISSSIPPPIFERLKAIENKILYLETVSPEYFHFLTKQSHRITKKLTYTLDDLDKIICGIEAKS